MIKYIANSIIKRKALDIRDRVLHNIYTDYNLRVHMKSTNRILDSRSISYIAKSAYERGFKDAIELLGYKIIENE